MSTNLSVWTYRLALFALLFGVNSLSYGGNSLNPVLDKAVSGITLLGMLALVATYPAQPSLYKVVAWAVGLGVVLLVLESKYNYGEWVYSYFVLKRFAYCGLALSAYYVARQVGLTRPGTLRLEWVIWLIGGLYVVNQLLLGQILSYALTSETRTTTAPEAFYLVLPFLFYLVRYVQQGRWPDLGLSVFVFGLIVFLLHRSVMSSAGVAGALVLGLVALGKIQHGTLRTGRTLGAFALVALLLLPFGGLFSDVKADGFVEQLAGLFDPAEDNTGSWRIEQSRYYMAQFDERPLLGWRYDGYDRGEYMDNEDFPVKGTIIHSQYVDMLYNYGLAGLALNLLLMLGTLWVLYRRNGQFTLEQATLFGFIASGLLFALSYQLPVFYWGFVGLGMFYGLHQNTTPDEESNSQNAASSTLHAPEQYYV